MIPTTRQPAIFISHGGGPWPFVDMPLVTAGALEPLARHLRSLVTGLPTRPKAALVVSAHWEQPVATLMTSQSPPMFYDYTGYEQKAYELQWPAPGATFLVERVASLLARAGFPTATDPERGFDHGTFIPLMVALPAADLPILQVSLLSTLDPLRHIELGRALAPLRDEGVLLLGSGNSYHNMRGFGHPESAEPSRRFDAWLADAMSREPSERERLLIDWEHAPSARDCHPREEHLLPLHVMAGAGLTDPVTFPLRMEALHVHATSVQFG